MNTDHSGLNKFSGIDDENFSLLLPEIQRILREAPSVVLDRNRRNGTKRKGAYTFHKQRLTRQF
jgi:hypothetical protein